MLQKAQELTAPSGLPKITLDVVELGKKITKYKHAIQQQLDLAATITVNFINNLQQIGDLTSNIIKIRNAVIKINEVVFERNV